MAHLLTHRINLGSITIFLTDGSQRRIRPDHPRQSQMLTLLETLTADELTDELIDQTLQGQTPTIQTLVLDRFAPQPADAEHKHPYLIDTTTGTALDPSISAELEQIHTVDPDRSLSQLGEEQIVSALARLTGTARRLYLDGHADTPDNTVVVTASGRSTYRVLREVERELAETLTTHELGWRPAPDHTTTVVHHQNQLLIY